MLQGDLAKTNKNHKSSSGIGCSNRLRNFGDLLTGTNDALAVGVANIVDIGVLLLRALPDLNLATTTDNTDTHGRKQVVGSVGVEVHTTVEHGSGVLADTRVDHGPTTRVVLDKIGYIMDNTGNGNQATAILCLLNIVVPFHNRQLIKRNTPVELSTALVEFLLKLLKTALFDFVGTELLQVVGETELLAGPDEPLGRVVLVPFDGIAVVRRELVVEVVVSFAEGNESGNDVIARRVAVIEWLVTEPVGQRVDTEGSLLDEENTQDTSIHKTTPPVTPAKTSDHHGENETHERDDFNVVAVLELNNGVLVQVGDVSAADTLGVLLHDHPSQVRVQETLADGVGIFLSVGITVMSTVTTSPPADGALDGTTASCSEEDLERKSGRVRAVSPETVVS